MLRSKNVVERRAAVLGLSALRRPTVDAVRALLDALVDDNDIDLEVIRALFVMRGAVHATLDELLRDLRSRSVAERRRAADHLALTANWAEEHLESAACVRRALIEGSTDEDEEVRRATCVALGHWKSDESEARQSLLRRLIDPSSLVRAAACVALREYGAEVAKDVSEVAARLRDVDPDVREAAAEAVGRICAAHRDALATKVSSVGRPTALDLAGIGSDGGLQNPTARVLLAGLLGDSDTRCVKAALNAMIAIVPLEDSERDQIAGLRTHADPGIRTLARVMLSG